MPAILVETGFLSNPSDRAKLIDTEWQQKMAEDVGISRRNIQRFLYELRDAGYIRIERQDRRFNNTYVIVDKVMTKLKTKSKTHHFDLDAPRAAHPMRH